MTLSFFHEEQVHDNSLPFSEDYLKSNPTAEGQLWRVEEVIIAKSNKGIMLTTEFFLCWAYRNSKLCSNILEALEYYCTTMHGFQLMAKLDSTAKGCFSIAVDTNSPATWFNHGGKKYSLKKDGYSLDGTLDTRNPFLLPAPSPSTTARARKGKTEEPPY